MKFDFKGKYIIEMELVCLTGLHIGGIAEGYEIGGMENPVIKTPVAMEISSDGETYEIPAECPYIPGSSLKGKLRSLLEWAEGRVKEEEVRDEQGKLVGYKASQCTCGDCDVCQIFGSPAGEATKRGPTRLYVFDAFPTKDTIKNWERDLGEGIFTEIKMENVIDRLSAHATPRQMERVPAGSRFKVRMVYDIYQDEDVQKLKKVFVALKLLEDNPLGGGGSRGSGRVAFEKFKVIKRPKEFYYGEGEEEEVKGLEGKKTGDIVRDFNNLDFSLKGRGLNLSWAGALKDYKSSFTSLELQKKALEWMGDEALKEK